MEINVVQKIYPTPEELSSVCSKVKCSEDKCEAVFRSTSNLNMHLIKHHKLPGSELTSKKTEAHYFCPANSCPYNKDSNKHFTKLKYLKQHYLKVHALKEFVCMKCEKKFSTETFKSLHMKNCGKLFTCTCGSYYNSSEAILTHCKRKGKGHTILDKTEKIIKVNNKATAENDHIKVKKTERVIYPKITGDMSFPIHYIAAIALSELSAPCNLSKVVDKGIQTEIYDFNTSKDVKNNNTSLKCDKKRKNSQQTQTMSGRCKKLKISAQTQTNCDYLKHKVKAHPKTVLKKRKKSMETQTKDHIKEDNFKTKLQLDNEKDLFSSFNSEQKDTENGKVVSMELVKDKSAEGNMVEDKARKWLWDNQFFTQKGISPSTNGVPEVKNQLLSMGGELNLCNKELNLNEYSDVSSKTNENHYGSEQASENQMFDFNKLCNIETQTEIDTFLTECNEDTTFTLCSTTETQTTDDFDSLLYSNMCTQTCEEVDQLFNFNFVHIETQTAWPDLNELDS